jgi:starch-binding outer membrane protein, SusD/RagB family
MTISWRRGSMAAVLMALAAGGCDTKVTNPGPVQDSFLSEPTAQVAVLAGMGRALSEGMNWIVYTGAAVAREIHPAGSTGSFGITVPWQRGELDPLDTDLNTHWEQAQQARWYAENGLARMKEVVPDSARLLAQANLWAGYSNRLLGDNMCQAVFDGGPAEDYTKYYERAEAFFTSASTLGTGDVKTAALAGRASARVGLGKWAEAVADAGQVPTAFKYNMSYFNVGDNGQYNRIEFAVHNQPYRAYTIWGTWIDAYYAATSDPRVPYDVTTLTGDAGINCCGSSSFRAPFYHETKYTTQDAPVTLSKGAEMRLIEAENDLRAGSFQAALTKINALRAAAGVPDATGTTAAEVWTALKRERAIVLWMEGRRLGDLRRWKDGNTPGDLDPLEVPSGDVNVGSHLVKQDLCFPISRSERDTNPNIS